MKFVIAIEPSNNDCAFGVVVPDLPGCFAAGDTIEEARTTVVEAIESICACIAEDGETLPKERRTLSVVSEDPAYKGWVLEEVEADVEKYWIDRVR